MKINCSCGRHADTKEDIDTISLYKVKTPTLKHTLKGERVVEELFYYWICPWCEKSIVLIKRKALNSLGHRKALIPVTLSGLDADEYLTRTQENRVNKTETIRYMTKPYSKSIDLVYFKVLTDTTQRGRYLNESGYSGNKITSNIIIIK